MKKNKDKSLRQQKDRYIQFKHLVRTCVHLKTRLKAMEEIL